MTLEQEATARKDAPVRPADETRGSLGRRTRKFIVRRGKHLFRRLNAFLGSQSLVGDTPILDKEHFPYLQPLETNWRKIRAELDEVLEVREALPSFHELSPDQWKISRGNNWKTFVFWAFGERSVKNCERCPTTAAVLAQIPGITSAWFSILAPGYHIPMHRGVTKGLVRVHLGLKVPQQRENCRMSVGDALVVWEEGQYVVFDDTFKHEVFNDTTEERVVLLLDFVRPMRGPGRLLHRTMMGALKMSPYFRDAKANYGAWETRFEKALAKMERDLN